MTWTRSYSDEQLIAAVARSTSWRGVLRELGLTATSAGAMRSVRAHADRISADHNHFRGRRRWTETELRSAIGTADSWSKVVEALGLEGPSSIRTVRGHAARLGIESGHLTAEPSSTRGPDIRPDIVHLDRAGSLLAAAWYTLTGQEVAWPLEPSRYDLLVSGHEGTRRVQVKTTTVRAGDSWKVYLSTSRGERRTYDPEEIDDFFIIDGDLHCYLMPFAAVGGLHAIHLGGYSRFRVAQLGGHPLV
ncbi:hypothetical protein DQ239_02285 [Blastococcus sp. TF02-09]|uniref:hypothetical protein n=1 Tax=Blastococcus sp. TF02-09 TaxID=2250576 RepID=UPI000E14F095|nr:hypothetical protein [Blastococcus sp. TF02-9]RBY81435.1 hypothetical protein DQ239_02285 [Blastococcus sp. TF02-9]